MAIAVQNQKPAGDQRFHWTVDTFYRAVSADVFEEPNRLELIRGEIWKKEPVNPPHAILIEDIVCLFRMLFDPQFWVREEKPFHVASDSEPVPDIQVVDSSARATRGRHPRAEDVKLVVEVADSSADRDTREKALLYAQAGIADYWVSLIRTRELVVFRAPSSEGYQSSFRLTEQDMIRPLIDESVEIPVRDLLYDPETVIE